MNSCRLSSSPISTNLFFLAKLVNAAINFSILCFATCLDKIFVLSLQPKAVNLTLLSLRVFLKTYPKRSARLHIVNIECMGILKLYFLLMLLWRKSRLHFSLFCGIWSAGVFFSLWNSIVRLSRVPRKHYRRPSRL